MSKYTSTIAKSIISKLNKTTSTASTAATTSGNATYVGSNPHEVQANTAEQNAKASDTTKLKKKNAGSSSGVNIV